jgi:hypothetical protein
LTESSIVVMRGLDPLIHPFKKTDGLPGPAMTFQGASVSVSGERKAPVSKDEAGKKVKSPLPHQPIALL